MTLAPSTQYFVIIYNRKNLEKRHIRARVTVAVPRTVNEPHSCQEKARVCL